MEHRVDDSTQHVCPILCVMLFVCQGEDVSESVQHNRVLQCRRPHPFLLAPLHGFPSGLSKQPPQDIKRKEQRKKEEGRDRDRNEIPDMKTKLKSKTAGKQQGEEKNSYY